MFHFYCCVGSIFRATKKSKYSNPRSGSRSQNVKNCFKSHTKDVKRLIFCGVEFLLTGFSSKKEREIVGLIQKCGGMVLLDIPTPPSSSRAKRISRSNFQKLPIVICSKKVGFWLLKFFPFFSHYFFFIF